MAASASVRSQVFISYSHQDTSWLERLQVHLTPGERDGLFAYWDDTRIQPGDRWRDEIEQALANARVAVLLVSADFLASDFIARNELPPLLERAQQGGVRILPVIVSPCRYAASKLAPFQAVNALDQSLLKLAKVEQEELLVKTAEAIEDALTNP